MTSPNIVKRRQTNCSFKVEGTQVKMNRLSDWELQDAHELIKRKEEDQKLNLVKVNSLTYLRLLNNYLMAFGEPVTASSKGNIARKPSFQSASSKSSKCLKPQDSFFLEATR